MVRGSTVAHRLPHCPTDCIGSVKNSKLHTPGEPRQGQERREARPLVFTGLTTASQGPARLSDWQQLRRPCAHPLLPPYCIVAVQVGWEDGSTVGVLVAVSYSCFKILTTVARRCATVQLIGAADRCSCSASQWC